jgi:hypothetical protein
MKSKPSLPLQPNPALNTANTNSIFLYSTLVLNVRKHEGYVVGLEY